MIPNTVKVTLDPCGGVLSEGESPVDRMYGSIYRDLPTPTRHGYTFDGWYTAETDGDRISYYSEVEQMTDHTIYAHWKRDYNHLATPKQTDAALKTPADCENDAVYFWSCSGCGLLDTSRTFTVKGTAFGHDYTWTSNGNGTHTGVCSHDKSHIKTENCSGGTATCTKKAVCAKCGAEYGDLGDHTYGTEWHSDSTHHWHECFRCKGVDSKVLHADNDQDISYYTRIVDRQSRDICSKRLTEHTGGTATCTKKAVCTFCGKEYGELAPHSFTAENTDAKYLKTAATCTAKAVYYKSCAACGAAGTETFEYGEPESHSYTAENTDAKYLKTAASCTAKAVYYKSCADCGAIGTETFEYGEKNPDNHSGKAEWTATASTHEQKWSCCGMVAVSAEGHSFGEWVVTKSPTYSQRGIRTHTCELCGYEESEYIPATGGGKTPRTGDDSALGLWSLLMCTSLTGALSLTALGLKRRTKKEQ